MRWLRVLFIVFFSFVTVFLMTMITVTITANMLLSPSFYSDSLAESGIYESIEQSIGKDTQTTDVQMPSGGMKIIVDSLLEEILSYIRGASDDLNLVMTESNQKLRESFLRNIRNLRICKDSEVNNPNPKNPCRPKDITPEELLEQSLKSQGVSLEDNREIDLTENFGLSGGSESRQSIDDIRGVVSTFKILLIVYFIALIIFFVFIYFLMPWQKRYIILIIGINVTVTALLILCFGSGLETVKTVVDVGDTIMQSILEIALTKLSGRIIQYGIILFLLGMGLIIAAIAMYYISKNKLKMAESPIIPKEKEPVVPQKQSVTVKKQPIVKNTIKKVTKK